MPGFTKCDQCHPVLYARRGRARFLDDRAQFCLTPTLTQKVLRLANSSMYAAFGQHVNTISKAVLVLGTDSYRSPGAGPEPYRGAGLAGDAGLTEVAHIEMEKAVLAGMVAQQRPLGVARRAIRKKRSCARSCMRWAA